MLQITLHESEDVLEIIERDFQGLYSGALGISSIRGGQTAANDALKHLDITGYAHHRSQVLPRDDRGASVLSPYIRHNMLTLRDAFSLMVQDVSAAIRSEVSSVFPSTSSLRVAEILDSIRS